jgi:hypothetical protein
LAAEELQLTCIAADKQATLAQCSALLAASRQANAAQRRPASQRPAQQLPGSAAGLRHGASGAELDMLDGCAHANGTEPAQELTEDGMYADSGDALDQAALGTAGLHNAQAQAAQPARDKHVIKQLLEEVTKTGVLLSGRSDLWTVCSVVPTQ